jgi:hypothetical protein
MRTAQAALIASCFIAAASPAFADDPVTISQAVAAAVAGGGNTSTINQVGVDNLAQTYQLGSQNYAGIGQYGNNNSSVIIQTGTGGLVIDNQYGNGNRFSILQTGPRPQPIVINQRR